MNVSELPVGAVLASGAAVGLALGRLGGVLADRLPGRYGITHLASAPAQRRRNLALALLTAAVGAGIAHVLAGAALPVGHAALLLAFHAAVVASVLAGAAIDLEHMILPNELTLGGAAFCLLTSPVRSVGIVGSVAGAVAGLFIALAPLWIYKKLRGQSGMGLGDAKLAVMAGAWHGVTGAVFVLFAGAVQSMLAAVGMRLLGLRFEMPESVRQEIAELRRRAEAGDEDARDELADDPMANEAREDTLGMRLPLGPFLALACVELLFLRRWLETTVIDWLAR